MAYESRQALVDAVFARCLANDVRDRAKISDAIRTELDAVHANPDEGVMAVWTWENPSEYLLHVMISRVASREDAEGQRKYFPSYGEPHRFLSIERVGFWVSQAGRRKLRPAEEVEFRAQLADLERLDSVWTERIHRAQAVRDQIERLISKSTILGLAMT